MYQYIEREARDMLPELIAIRKDLHRHPETAWKEQRTSTLIANQLNCLGYEVYEGNAVSGHATGVVGILHCGPGPVIALRFDIDALSVTESDTQTHIPFREGFASETPGLMHACGHDGHMTIGLGCAKLLASLRSHLTGTIRLIFQPAEEGARGALPITEHRWLDGVSFFLSGHIFNRPKQLSSDCNLIPGVRSSLATTKMDLEFFGQSAHAAHPEQGRDVIAAMAEFICRCKNNSSEEGFIQIGTICGGSGRNIIADYGKLEMETRAHTTMGDHHLNQLIDASLEKLTDERGITWRKTITGSAPSVVSSPKLAEKLKMLYDQNLPSIHTAPSMFDFPASEDVSHMMNRVKEQGGEAVFFLFPAALAADLHHTDFDFPMELLSVGVTVYTAAVYHLLDKA